MALTGYLSDYSLAEILHFIQQENKTGLLSICIEKDLAMDIADTTEYTWFQAGRVVTHTKDMSSLGLIAMLEKRNWIGSDLSTKLRAQAKSMAKPLGLQLKSSGVLEVEQLRILFHAQVLQAVCALFKLQNAKFYFDDQASLAHLKPEMTGMSVAAAEVSLLGLRVLKDWAYLEHKLPSPDFGLQRFQEKLPEYKLDTQEIQMLKEADGFHNISEIAKEMEISVMKAQQIAFRLIAVGLLKEIALDSQPLNLNLHKTTKFLANVIDGTSETVKPELPESFLNNLVGFFQKQK